LFVFFAERGNFVREMYSITPHYVCQIPPVNEKNKVND